jgi:plasmid stability protein
MSKTIQVRNVPDGLHEELTRRARARGQTLAEYIRALLEREVVRPPTEEVFDRIEARAWVNFGRRAADLIREERAALE